jgi:hypothetical protein
VKKVMREFKHHELRSGRSGKKVTNPKQAIAIGLSEAREAGAKIPKKGAAKKRSSARKTSSRKTASKSGHSRSGSTRKRTARKR